MCVCVCDLYEIYDNNFNYYHYQPGSNIIIVYCRRLGIRNIFGVFFAHKKFLDRTET